MYVDIQLLAMLSLLSTKAKLVSDSPTPHSQAVGKPDLNSPIHLTEPWLYPWYEMSTRRPRPRVIPAHRSPTQRCPSPGGEHVAELIQDAVEFHLQVLQGATGLGIQLRGARALMHPCFLMSLGSCLRGWEGN